MSDNIFMQMMEDKTPEALGIPKNQSNTPKDDNIFIRMMEGRDTGVAQTISPEIEEDTEPTMLEVGGYSTNDIVANDELYKIAEDYMDTRFNVDDLRGYSREELVNKALNNMRGFAGGNTVRAINELAFLNSLNSEDSDDLEKLNKVGKFYTMFEGMESLFGDTTASEKMEILGDYTREALLDPANLIGFGVGKFLAAGGGKVATRIAQKKAMDVYKKNLLKGKSKKTAKKKANKVWAEVMKGAAEKEVNRTVKNRIKNQQAKGFRRLGTAQGLKEIGGVTAVEMTASVGTALAYEDGLVRTTDKESQYVYAGGIAAIGSLVVGGALGTASVLGTKLGKRDLALPASDVAEMDRKIKLDNTGANLSLYTNSLANQVNAKGGKEAWKKKVKLGEDLAVGNYADTLFEDMLIGNRKKGIVGLSEIIHEEGFTWMPRTKDDRVGYWITDIIKDIDPQDVKKFFKDFEETTGVTVYTSPETGIERKLSEFTPEDFSNSLAYWIKQRGKGLGILSKLERVASGKRDVTQMTLGDFSKSMFQTGLAQEISPKESSLFRGKLGENVEKLGFGAEGIKAGQNRIVRMLVSAPSTSYLNMVGWAAATSLNSATDLGMGLIFAGKATGQALMRNPNAKESLRIALAYSRANFQKARNLFDPNTTYDAFKSISVKNPEAMRELIRVLPGGVEDIDKVIKASGFNPDQTIGGTATERLVDYAQFISFVKAQDVFTKSQEFIYHLDKNLDISFGKSFTNFYKDPEAQKLMNSKKYKQAVARATYETQRAIFSLSYKDDSTIGEIAGAIENIRNIPGLGLLAPFGRFFNNTVAFMSDISGVSLGQKIISEKILGLPSSQTRSAKEIAVRTAIGMGFLATMIQDEEVYKEQNLGPFQVIDPSTGAVKDRKYDFPVSHLKGAARILSYLVKRQEVPREEIKQIRDTVGLNQLTRQLNQTVGGLGDAVDRALSGDVTYTEAIFGTFGKMFSQPIAGFTRALDPYNSLIGLARGENFKVIDRKQGSETLNNALRYMDQFIGATAGDLQQEKFTASMGDIRSDASKNLGYREVELTDTAKMYNRIGKPDYLINRGTKIAVAGNRFNEIFHEQLEALAGDLLRSVAFKEGKISDESSSTQLEVRKLLVEDVQTQAKQQTKEIMETAYENLGDMRLIKMLNLENKYSLPKIDRGIKVLEEELGEDLDFKDLSIGQLETLELHLEGNKYYDSLGKQF